MFLTKDSLTSRDSSISFIYYVIATHAKDNHSQNYQTHSDPVVARSTPLLYLKQSFKWKTCLGFISKNIFPSFILVSCSFVSLVWCFRDSQRLKRGQPFCFCEINLGPIFLVFKSNLFTIKNRQILTSSHLQNMHELQIILGVTK